VKLSGSVVAPRHTFVARPRVEASHDEERAERDSQWLLKLALATGFPSSRSLVTRSILAVAGTTLIQRFVVYPSASVPFDAGISIAGLAILMLLGNFMVRAG
jgi:hypothetical protein